ncbi:hypothetical protein [Bacteroides difficilis]|nr:hypothetical protein [Bacteroides difficilis]
MQKNLSNVRMIILYGSYAQGYRPQYDARMNIFHFISHISHKT